MSRVKILVIMLFVLASSSMLAQDVAAPPGVVIDYMPSEFGKYIGSPSICIMPNGDYVASHDQFGPKSSEFQSAQTLVFKSSDKGKSWRKISQINGQFWSNIFLFKGDLYIMGTNKHHGNVVLRKSTDAGQTWTNPHNGENGLILEGEYHTAPVPMVEHNGRLWRTMEYATAESDKWGERYSAVMLSVPVDTDIMDAKNWTRSNSLFFNESYLNGNFKAWLEGNAVVDKDGNMVNILRVHQPPGDAEKMALVYVNADGSKISFDSKDFFEMPGASKKFTIRYDEKSKTYWTIVNNIPEEYKGKANPDRIRNFVSIATSSDLKTWTLGKTLFSHPDHLKHGFQYIDWVFEGDDIILVSRTAFEDKYGGARGYHDANFMTFHRVKNFRKTIK